MSNIGNGNKGRFSDRLKRMRYNRLYRKKKIKLEDGEIVYKNFLKVVAVIPLMVAGNILDTSISDIKKKSVINGKNDVSKGKLVIKGKEVVDSDLKEKESIIDVTDRVVSNVKKIINEGSLKVQDEVKNVLPLGHELEELVERKKESENANKIIGVFEEKSKDEQKNIADNLSKNVEKKKEDEPKEERTELDSVKELEKKIINLIKKDLVKVVNTLEIYESELYILSEINNDEKTLEKCKKNIAEVRKLLSKIEELKKKYDYLKDTYDFEYLLEIGNEEIIDKITELRGMVNNDEIKTVVADYKLLDVYKYLYTRVDDIKANADKIEEEKLKQEEELRKRDIDFDKLKNNVFDINKVNESYSYFVSEQDRFLKNLSDKISKIDSHENVDYHIKGFGKYLFNSAKYLGLLMLNPLKGIFPSITTQTIIAGNMVNNLRNNIKWKKETKMVYEAIDYSSTIGLALNDLSYTSEQLDSTLDNLARLKMEYNNKFRQYKGDFLEYRDVIDKITSIQETMINNKIKLEIMKNRMYQYQKKNQNKLQLVRQLNKDEVNKNN